MTPLVEARDLRRHFRIRMGGALLGGVKSLKAVDGVSFRIERGRTLGLVGESGCGKSTLARLALGMTAPDAGQVVFDGVDVTRLPTGEWRRLRRRMQMVFQDPLGALDRRLTVLAQVEEPLRIHGLAAPAERRERALGLLEGVGLQRHLGDRYPHELSGGQRQRVVLARALILEPDFLVCDEPISALDVSIQAQVVNLLLELQQKFGLTFLFISHDLKVVRHVSDEIAVMYLGRIVEQGSRERLFARPEHPYTRALIAAVPTLDRERRRGRTLLAGDPPSPLDLPKGCRFQARCPLAGPLCRHIEPELVTLADGHRVACHVAAGATLERAA
ncbi:ABC transporter ATP-binding protein [Desertibaculum subflavum]|uniref:ABC transporter ATP-binding protein n=1 Tax=Desertibaculum subflavum TaxID=2268458 RepID=UPI000E663412